MSINAVVDYHNGVTRFIGKSRIDSRINYTALHKLASEPRGHYLPLSLSFPLLCFLLSHVRSGLSLFRSPSRSDARSAVIDSATSSVTARVYIRTYRTHALPPRYVIGFRHLGTRA